MDLFGRFKKQRLPRSGVHDLAAEAGLASACAATAGVVPYVPPTDGESPEQACERMGRTVSLLYEQELTAACSHVGVDYVPPAAAEGEKKRRERIESMQGRVHEALQLGSDSLREFFDKELGNLPLSVAMCGHMMRADGTPGSVDELVARFRSIRLEVVDQEGQNPQTSHPHYFGLLLSVLFAVERIQGSGAHAQADKANAVHLLAMLSVLPGSATPVALFGGSDSGLFGCDEECVDRARAMLAQFGLLRPATEVDVHVGTVHQLVQRCVEQQLRTTRLFDSPEEAKRTLRSLVARLAELAARWGMDSCKYTRVDDQVAPCVASILDHWSTVADAVATGPLHFATKADLEVRL
jgi:hypothetical protein